MGLIEELLKEPTLVVSYYTSASIAILFSAWEALASQGKEVCVINLDKLPKDVPLNYPNYQPRCSETSENLVYAAERPSEVPVRFRLAISVRRILEDVRWGRVEKVENNLFRLWLDDEVYLFRVVNERVKDESLPPISKAIIEVLDEYGGRLPMKDVVLIVSGKTRATRDQVRANLALLKNVGLVEIEEGVVSLNNYGGLKRGRRLL
ncbi:MAG: hypothetical protein ACP5HQ_05940 [Thermoprotei archaeon]